MFATSIGGGAIWWTLTYEVTAGMVFVAGKTVWSMPERFKVVCIQCKALYNCSALSFFCFYFSAVFFFRRLVSHLADRAAAPCHHHWLPIRQRITFKWLIEQGLMSHQTHYRSCRDDFYRSYDQTNSVKALKETSWSCR